MNAMKRDMSIAAEAPMGMGLIYGPMRPETKAIGSKAAMTVNVASIVGFPTSSTAFTATEALTPDILKCL